jgi:lysophospholipase L1-like esterase
MFIGELCYGLYFHQDFCPFQLNLRVVRPSVWSVWSVVEFGISVDANAPLDIVVLSLGVNELKHMFNLTAGMISFGMEKLVLAAKQSYYGYPVPKVLIVSPAPVHSDIEKFIFGFSFGPLAYAKSREFSKLYCEVAENHGCGYVDASSLGITLNTLDGIHYNREDHAKLGASVAEKIREMLG